MSIPAGTVLAVYDRSGALTATYTIPADGVLPKPIDVPEGSTAYLWLPTGLSIRGRATINRVGGYAPTGWTPGVIPPGVRTVPPSPSLSTGSTTSQAAPKQLQPGFVDPDAVRPGGNYCPVCGTHHDDPPRSSTAD